MAEGEDLTSEQTERLLQYQDLTGIDDFDRCKEVLRSHNWDIEMAVQAKFNEEEGSLNNSIDNHNVREQRTPQVLVRPTDQRVYHMGRNRSFSLFSWGYFVISYPFKFVYRRLTSLLLFVYHLLWADPRRYVTDPYGDVMNFIRFFDDVYGMLHPLFYRGTYSDALNEAKRELRFLLVYLHGDDHQDTDYFCRYILCNENVAGFINTHMLFWACNTNSPEGYRVSQALRETTYPFLAVIVLRQHRMTVVARLEGVSEPFELIARLNDIMNSNEASLVAARMEREERNLTQNLRQEQDQAYQESLRMDQEKERKRKEEVNRKMRAEEEAQEREREIERKAQELLERKEEIRRNLPMEPDVDDPNAVKILLKLPNGIRLERRFHRTDSLRHLYNYVLVHESAPDDFQIIKNLPRQVLPCQPTADNTDPPTFEQVGLGRSEMLFVQDNEA